MTICKKPVVGRKRARPWLEALEDRITPNTAPVAVADTYNVHQGEMLQIASPGVLDNDYDADQDPITAEEYTSTTNGILILFSDGSFDYTPDSGFSGTDYFEYQAYDGTDYSDPATVTINVTNEAPEVTADFYETHQGDELNVSAANGVLANDTDADSDDLEAELVSSTTDGILIQFSDGSFDYTPDSGFSGSDSFTYRAYDGAEYSSAVTVTIDVTNEAPVGEEEYYWTSINDDLYVSDSNGVLVNDADGDEDSLTAVLYSDVTSGILTLYSNGAFDYTPNLGFEGTDFFEYRAFDGAEYSDPIPVNILVSDVPTFIVNTTNDTQDGNAGNGFARDNQGRTSLRAAIEEGHAQQGDDFIIQFAGALDNATINLGIALPNLNKDFTIDGSGAEDLTVQRNPAVNDFRVVTINSTKTVTISDLSLANGRAAGQGSARFGGGIYNGGTLTLVNVSIFDNEASKGGGGIFNGTNSVLFVEESYIYNNSAELGGGIANDGDASVEDVEIFANEATLTGGGIFNYPDGEVDIEHSDIYANEAVHWGGGISNYGDFSMTGGTLYLNLVTYDSGVGGGLYNARGESEFTNVSITDNEAEGDNGKGGAVYVYDGSATFTSSTFQDNDCGLEGGGTGGCWHPDGAIYTASCTIIDQDFVVDSDE